MKIHWLISYYYSIRWMKSNQIPLSTAIYPPKWYALNGRNRPYLDRNGVINSLEIPLLIPNNTIHNECRGPENCEQSPKSCRFLQGYYEQLKAIDFKNLQSRTEGFIIKAHSALGLEAPDTVDAILMVHETPEKACSERWPLKNWFHENGTYLEEFNWRTAKKRKENTNGDE